MKKYMVTVGLIVVVMSCILTLALLQSGTGELSKTTAAMHCQGRSTTHTVVIKGNQLSPIHTEANLCDTLTITNDDDTLRLMAFGSHDHHIPYNGVTEKLLQQGQSLTVMLDQTGTFTFHDHLHDSLVGQFTVHN